MPLSYLSELPAEPLSGVALSALAFYMTAAISACGLYLLLRPAATQGISRVRAGGTIVALAGVALLAVETLRGLGAHGTQSIPVLPALLGLIALGGAVRMVTHPKPVFAALYFVLVVVSSSGLFLLLQAEFMAFALIIVYAGAILITYMFVLMLAQQSLADAPVGAGDIESATMYDRVPREPLYAVTVGFLLLATLGDAMFAPSSTLRLPISTAAVVEARLEEWRELEALPKLLEARVRAIEPNATPLPAADTHVIHLTTDGVALAHVTVVTAEGQAVRDLPLPLSAMPTNTQRVGLWLVSRFPASLELASVILLMAMFGAVVLARKQIELGEDERREAAGLRRLSLDEPEPTLLPGAGVGAASGGAKGGRP